MSDNDQPSEGPMAIFVNAVSDHAALRVRALVEELASTIADLERPKDSTYTTAIRFLLAGEASLKHALAQLATAKKEKHHQWSAHQRDAVAFLGLRTAAFGREFVVSNLLTGDRYPGLPPAGTRIRFVIENAPGLNGGRYAKRVGLETWSGDGFVRRFDTMTLQTLHRAFLDRVVLDAAPEGEREDLVLDLVGPGPRRLETGGDRG